MRIVQANLLFLCAAFPGALAALASGTGKDSAYLGIPILPHAAQDPGDEIQDPQDPEDPVATETPAPTASEPAPPVSTTAPEPAATPPTNPIIENITWEGTGCPAREADDQDASVTVQLEEDGSFGAYFFNNFDAYLGWTEDEVETEAECQISMELVGIPEGWSFQIQGVRAEGTIYLETGAIAVFNSTVYWSGDDEHVFTTGKYWPNLDQEDPVDQNYVTDPLLLTAENQTEFGSACAAEGAGPSSGTLNINFRISMQSAAEPAPNGIVSVLALGITNQLVECEASASTPGRCKKRKMKKRQDRRPVGGIEAGSGVL